MRLFRSHRSVVSSSFCLVSSHDRQLQTSPLGGRGVKRRPAKVLPRASKRRKLAAERYTDETSKHENGPISGAGPPNVEQPERPQKQGEGCVLSVDESNLLVSLILHILPDCVDSVSAAWGFAFISGQNPS